MNITRTLTILEILLVVLIIMGFAFLISRLEPCTCVREGKWGEIEGIIMEVYGNNKLIYPNYVCTDLSRDTVLELREHGYEAYIMGAYDPVNESAPGHAWVKVCYDWVCRDYDVVNGLEKPDSKYKKVYYTKLTDDGERRGIYCPEAYCMVNWTYFTHNVECGCDFI